MFLITLKLIFRNLARSKLFSAINIIGIVIGFTVSTLLLLYVKNQLTANNFFPNNERIYRVENNGNRPFSKRKVDVLRNHVPEIEHITKYHGSWSQQDIARFKDHDYELENAFYADSVFFTVFAFESLYGDLQRALDKPFNIVLTRSQSEKIFGKVNPVGEIVTIKTSGYGINEYTVAAVMEDIPNNCSFRFDAAFSLSSLKSVDWYDGDANYWGSNFYTVFALLPESYNETILLNKIKAVYDEYAPEWVSSEMNVNFAPLKGLQFTSKFSDGVFNMMSKPIVNLLGTIGIFIILIACFNYFNLTIAQLGERIKTVGIKKTVGAGTSHLRFQSFLETSILFMLSFAASFGIIKVILPFYNNLTLTSFTLHDILSSSNLLLIVLFFLISLLIFGIFPAIIAGNQKVLTALKSNAGLKNSNHWFRNSLVIFQFSISTILIIGTIMLNKQYKYMLNADYGYDRESVLYIPLSPESFEKKDLLETEYEKNAHTVEVAFANSVFGWIANRWGRNLDMKGEEIHIDFDIIAVCPDFMKLFDLQLVRGNSFTDASSGRQDFIFNETFMKKYNISDLSDVKVNQGEGKGYVVGVVKDFNYNSMREKIEPMGIMCEREYADILYVKLNSSYPPDIKKTMDRFEKIWNEVSPDFPFEYHFMDEHFENVYRSEIHIMKILSVASVMTILIACLGLFGLAYLITNKRIKEIGVRKVNGARLREIIALLNREFILKVLIAYVIACPVVFILIEKWLRMYAFKAGVSWWIFLAGGIMIVAVAVLAVSYQSFRVASKNPVEALRYE